MAGIAKIAGTAVSLTHNFNAAKVLTINLNRSKTEKNLLNRTLILSAQKDEMIHEKVQTFKAIERNIENHLEEIDIKHIILGPKIDAQYESEEKKFEFAFGAVVIFNNKNPLNLIKI
jgi:hypothetical protein